MKKGRKCNREKRREKEVKIRKAAKQEANTLPTCVSLHRLQEKAIFFTRGLTLLTLITVPWIATNLPEGNT